VHIDQGMKRPRGHKTEEKRSGKHWSGTLHHGIGEGVDMLKGAGYLVFVAKEVIKEQPSYRNLSATATRVLQWTCPFAASHKYFLAIHTSPHLNSPHT
jgi:hypothetical protein